MGRPKTCFSGIRMFSSGSFWEIADAQVSFLQGTLTLIKEISIRTRKTRGDSATHTFSVCPDDGISAGGSGHLGDLLTSPGVSPEMYQVCMSVNFVLFSLFRPLLQEASAQNSESGGNTICSSLQGGEEVPVLVCEHRGQGELLLVAEGGDFLWDVMSELETYLRFLEDLVLPPASRLRMGVPEVKLHSFC